MNVAEKNNLPYQIDSLPQERTSLHSAKPSEFESFDSTGSPEPLHPELIPINEEKERGILSWFLDFHKSFLGRCFTIYLIITIVTQTFDFAEVLADPTSPFRGLWKQGSDGKLNNFYERAERQDAGEQGWNETVERGRNILRTEWEMLAEREIEEKLKLSEDKINTELDLRREKELARADWEIQVDDEIQNKRGEWKAKQASSGMDSLLEDDIDINSIKAVIVAAREQALYGSTTDERILILDSYLNTGLGMIRGDWESELDAQLETASAAGANLTGKEKLAFDKQLETLRAQFMQGYSYFESMFSGPARADFIGKENRSTDLQNAIAQETDPRALTLLLIEDVKRRIGEDGGLILQDVEGGSAVTFTGDGEDFQKQVEAAYQIGQKKWKNAIDVLIAQKLAYDEKVEEDRTAGNEAWVESYQKLLDARKEWQNTVNTQIEQGIAAWDASEVELQTNKNKALEELARYTKASEESWESHLYGLGNVVMASSSTVAQIKENIRWFTDARAKLVKNGQETSEAYTVYGQQLTYWQGLESKYRNIIASAESQVNSKDMRGVGGFLTNSGNGIMSTAEYELKLALKEKEYLEKIKNEAQAVYDYAINNQGITKAQIALQLEAAKEAYEDQEEIYLQKLKDLNGGGSLSISQPGIDSTATSTSSSSTTNPTTPQTSLDLLNLATKALQDSAKELEVARAELEASREAYNRALKTQVLLNNPSLLGDIGSIKGDKEGYTDGADGGLRQDISNANEEIKQATEKIRMQEKLYYQEQFERQNALRSNGFYLDSSRRIQSFEDIKDKKQILATVVGTTDDVSLKIQNLLTSDALVRIYGNETAQAIRAELEKIKTEYDGAGTSIVTSVTAFNTQLPTIQAQYATLISKLGTDSYSSLTALSSGLETGIVELKKIPGLDEAIGLTALGTVRQNWQTELALWNDKKSAYTDAYDDYTDAYNTYKTYADSHVGQESSLEYQTKLLEFTTALGRYQNEAATLETYLGKINAGVTSLRTYTTQVFAYASSYVDGKFTGQTRTDYLNSVSVEKGKYTTAATATETPLKNIGESLASFSNEMNKQGSLFNDYMKVTEAKYRKYESANGILVQLYDGLEANYQVEKKSLEFLLSESGDLDLLESKKNEIEDKGKTFGATVNFEAIKILEGILPANMVKADRRIDLILAKVTNDLNTKLSKSSLTDESERIQLEALKAVRVFLTQNQSYLATVFSKDEDYTEFVADFAKQKTQAQNLLQFYQSGGELTEAERARIKREGTEAEKARLYDYFNYGSGFVFAGVIGQSLNAYSGMVQGISQFVENVKSGNTASILTENYFKSQENKVTGILKELEDRFPEFAGVTSSLLYNDYQPILVPTQRDDSEEIRRKNILAEEFTGLTLDQKLQKLEDINFLLEIFGAGDLPGTIKKDIANYINSIATARAGIASYGASVNTSLSGIETNWPSALANTTASEKTYYGNLKIELDRISSWQNKDDLSQPITDPDTGVPIPGSYLKPFAGLDFSTFQMKSLSYATEVAKWDAESLKLTTAKTGYDTKLADLRAYEAANPADRSSAAYIAKLNDVKAALVATQEAVRNNQAYIQSLHALYTDAYNSSKTLLYSMKSIRGYDSSKILYYQGDLAANSTLQNLVTTQPSLFTMTFGFNDIDRELGQLDTLYSAREGDLANKDMVRNANVSLIDNALGAGNRDISGYSESLTKENFDVSMADLYINNLPSRIIAYMPQDNVGQVTQSELIGYVKNLREFFLEKQFKGEQVNSGLLEALEKAGAITDELENIQYYKDNRGRTKETVEAALAAAKTNSESLNAGYKSLQEAWGILAASDASGMPLYASNENLQKFLTKYEEAKAKLGTNISPDLETKVADLKTEAWEMYKRSLANYYLGGGWLAEGEEMSLSSFMTGLSAGKYVVAGETASKPKFLNNELTTAQFSELKEYLRPMDAKLRIINTEAITDLTALLEDEDDDLKSQLADYAVKVAYQNINAGLIQGYSMMNAVPDVLKKYSIIASYDAFLANDPDLSKDIANDRTLAKSQFLLNVGADAVTTALLDDYLANYSVRNASYYLPDDLKTTHLYESFFYKNPMDGMDLADITKLTTWLNEAKYEPSMLASVKQAARDRYIRSNYYGEGLKEYLMEIDSSLSASGLGGGLTNEEKQSFILELGGIGDPSGMYKLDPSGLVSSEMFLDNYNYSPEYEEIGGLLEANSLNLIKKTVEADALVRKETFARDIVTKAKKIESFESYAGIATDSRGYLGMAAPSEVDAIDNRLLELERIAEDKLGGFFAVIQEYNSNAYNNAPGYEVNLSIKRTIDAINDGYEIKDEAYTKNPVDGTYSFTGALDNILQRVSSYINANTPGFRSGVTDPFSVIQSQEANLRAQKETIITSGETIVQLTNIKNNYSQATVLNEINLAKTEFNAREDAYDTAKETYDTKVAAVETAQTNYNTALTETSGEYNTMLALEKNYSLKKALYEYATIAEYNQKNPGTENTSQTSYMTIITKRLDDAKKAFDDVVKRITELQTKVANQVTLPQLQNDLQVKENKRQAEEWAAKAIKFSAAEEKIKDRIVQLNKEVDILQAELDAKLLGVLGMSAPLSYNSLDGYLDYSSAAYTKREEYERSRARIVDGLVTGKLSTWDFVYGNIGGGDSENPMYSTGLSVKFPSIDLLGYFNTFGERSGGFYGGGFMQAAGKSMFELWFLDHSREYAMNRKATDDAASYDAAMGISFNNAMGAETIIINFFALWNPTTILMAASRRAAAETAFFRLKDELTDISSRGSALKAKVAELQTITDISSVEQLRSVLINTGGLTNNDFLMTQSDGQTKDILSGTGSLSNLKFEGGKETLSLEKIVGTEGKAVVSQKAIHDSYGYSIRGAYYQAGGATAGIQGTDRYGRYTSLLTSGDEISDALANMARVQYEIERDEYYISAEQVVINGVNADRKVILDDREAFHAKILKDARDNTNVNVEREMYRVLANDYFGEGKVADEIARISFAQNQGLQLNTWAEKENEFYYKKNVWLENINQLKKAGESQFDSMLSNFVSQWDTWKSDFEDKAKDGAEEYYAAIEEKLKGQKAWAEDFLRKSKDGSDKQLLVDLYESIDALIEQTRRSLPNTVSLNVNANDILAGILQNKPGTIDEGIAMAGKYVDTNFFMNEIRSASFDNSLLKTYETLQEDFENATEKMKTLQLLDVLYSLPKGFEEAIQQANKGVSDGLQQEMLGAGYIFAGGVFARTIVRPAGGNKIQILPNYNPYVYSAPKTFPIVKDSNGTSWMLSDTDKIMKSNLEASELEQMVKLATNKLKDDFKEVYNPAVKVNYEKDLVIFGGGVDFSGSLSEIFSQIGDNVRENLTDAGTDIMNSLKATGTGYGCTGSHEECSQSALNSMYLVGEVEGGTWGKDKFMQLYAIRKLKEEQDKEKGMNEATKSRRKIGIKNMHQGLSAVMQGVKEGVQGAFEMLKEAPQMAMDMSKDAGELAIEMYANPGYLLNPSDAIKKAKSMSNVVKKSKGLQKIQSGVNLAGAGVGQFVAPLMEALSDITTLGASTNRASDISRAFDRAYMESEYTIRNSDQYGSIQRETDKIAKNDKVLDAVVNIAAGVTAIVGTVLVATGVGAPVGAALIVGSIAVLGAWKAFRGAYEGGGAGMMAAAASAGINYAARNAGLSVDLSYTFANGFGASIDFAGKTGTGGVMRPLGAKIGLSYSEKEGFGINAGIGKGVSLGWGTSLSDNANSKGKSYGSISLDGSYAGVGMELGYTYNTKKETTYSIKTKGGGISTNYSYNSVTGFGVSSTYSIADWEDSMKAANAARTANNNGLGAGVLAGLGAYASGMWNDFASSTADSWSKIGSAVGNTISDAASATWNGIKKAWNKTVGRWYNNSASAVSDWWNHDPKPEKAAQEAAKIATIGAEAKQVLEVFNAREKAAKAKGKDGEGELAKVRAERKTYEANIMSEAAYIDFDSTDKNDQAKIKEMKAVLETMGITRLDKTELAKLEIDPKLLKSQKKSGMEAEVFRDKDGNITVAFRGTEGKGDYWADFVNGLGIQTDQYEEAAELARALAGNKKLEGKLSFTGHSLGGGLASLAASVAQVNAETFNAAGVHSNIIKSLGGKMEGIDNLVKANYLGGDFLSLSQDNYLLDAVGFALTPFKWGFNLGTLTPTYIPGYVPEALGRRVEYNGQLNRKWYNKRDAFNLHSNTVFLQNQYYDITNQK